MNVYKVTLECDHSYGSVLRDTQRPQFVLGKNGDEAIAQAKKAFRLFNPSLQGLECVVTDVKITEAPMTDTKGIVKTNDGNAAVVEFAGNLLRTYVRRDKDSVNDFNRHFIVGTDMYFNTEYLNSLNPMGGYVL
jgi:hypothetical protein